MPIARELSLRWLTTPDMVDAAVFEQLVACWRDVSNAGGAVGFPFLPVNDEQVRAAADAMTRSLTPQLNRLLIAADEGLLAGWLVLAGNASPLTSHWARVLRVQTSIQHRGLGVGRALMTEAARVARDDLGLEQLHLELRSGLGLEDFYRKLGWRETGRWPEALRLAESDSRDEVLMLLRLRC